MSEFNLTPPPDKPPGPRLYTVEVRTTVMVLANDAREAEDIALLERNDIDDWLASSYRCDKWMLVPSWWRPEDPVYGEHDEDITLGSILGPRPPRKVTT